jgi:hypothetical protein
VIGVTLALGGLVGGAAVVGGRVTGAAVVAGGRVTGGAAVSGEHWLKMKAATAINAPMSTRAGDTGAEREGFDADFCVRLVTMVCPMLYQ